jgi:hypothetical protein
MSFYSSYPVSGGSLLIGSPANGLDITAGVLTIQLSSSTQTGALSSTDWNTFNNKQAALGYTPENIANKGIANGYAPLDGGTKIPVAYLPNSIMDYLGTWDAATNTPTLVDGTGNAGDVYICNVAGTVNFGSGPITFATGDWVVYSGTVWQKSINSNAVASVNGLTGAVVLTTTNINEGTNLYFTNLRAQTAAVANSITSGITNVAPSQDAVFNALTLKANLSGATFTGSISATNFSGSSSGTNTGDQNLAPYALLASPAFTGTPTAPTAATGTNTTQIATTAYVKAEIPLSTAANISATSNSTLTTLSALSLPGSQVTGNISGNAANITATSNSTLTTLSALSLPGSQVTGDIAGNAANITASSNSTLTSLPNLSITQTQVTGLTTSLAGKASTTLNNLGTTAINADLLSAASNTINIGSSANYFANTFSTLFTTNGSINPDQINPTTPREIGNLFAFQRVRAARFSPDLTTYTFTGDFTSGSTSVTNVSPTIPAAINGGNYTIFASGFTTRLNGVNTVTPISSISSFTGTTITMANTALASGTGITFTVAPVFVGRSENGSTVQSGSGLLSSGTTTTAASGVVAIQSGSTTTGQSGDVIITSGASSSGGRTGGVLFLTGTTSGTRGKFTFQDGTQGTANQVIASTDTAGTAAWTNPANLFNQPNTQVFTSGSGTYTKSSAAVKWIRVKAIGGGGGGSGSGTGGGTGGTGGNTTFGTIITANGGAGATLGGNGGSGGTATLTGVTGIQISGGAGGGANNLANAAGGSGGNGFFGGGGFGGNGGASSGGNGSTNTGGGGGGGGTTATTLTGSGGGAGGYCEVLVTAANVSYSVGAGGTAGAAGTGGFAGGAGGSGMIIVEEYFV